MFDDSKLWLTSKPRSRAVSAQGSYRSVVILFVEQNPDHLAGGPRPRDDWAADVRADGHHWLITRMPGGFEVAMPASASPTSSIRRVP